MDPTPRTTSRSRLPFRLGGSLRAPVRGLYALHFQAPGDIHDRVRSTPSPGLAALWTQDFEALLLRGRAQSQATRRLSARRRIRRASDSQREIQTAPGPAGPAKTAAASRRRP